MVWQVRRETSELKPQNDNYKVEGTTACPIKMDVNVVPREIDDAVFTFKETKEAQTNRTKGFSG